MSYHKAAIANCLVFRAAMQLPFNRAVYAA